MKEMLTVPQDVYERLLKENVEKDRKIKYLTNLNLLLFGGILIVLGLKLGG
jgi:hypothetical protein